ncbi:MULTISPECIES: SpoIIE family protein phosphatase [unclassified Streptomyces]|uniref:ATP-binding SpoIIE family protein phosphatase n=1 Tax=unclassified Streptomyces TaxID=2593676 RepID=UPI00224DBEC9|nr:MULTISPECIES: SpoIIE family protein phosphatase [unclassified Streptomyces]MCX5337343.1 SpoIIE family protein phosphatase [Streptomyces sp. NBC_00140]MCX5365706.1 SpoIIE family protein phosphatase [Streptomyces sp. NBC_00124]
MDVTADRLVSRAAHALSRAADGLIRDVEECLRGEVPELWDDPEAMASANIAHHVVAVLDGLEYGAEPSRIEPPAEEIERARRFARHGIPVSTLLRAFRLGQGVLLDRLLQELPRLTDDAQLISAATRELLATATGYVDRTSEYGVLAYQEEREHRLRARLSLVNEAGLRIGTTLDITRTTQELADLAVEHFADRVTVDLLDSALHGYDVPTADPPVLRRMAQRPSAEEPRLHTCPDGSPTARALATGEPSRDRSTLVVPLRARGMTLGVAQFVRDRTADPYDDEDLLLAQEIAARAAVAVDNARRYTHARATALTLQRSLLQQHMPQQSAVEVACRYLPAGDRVGVGGDWYDVIPLSGARVALVVGDVVGHGIHAAATMGRLRTAVRTLADFDLPPDELLTHLDDIVIRLSAEAAEAAGEPDGEPAGDIGATCLYAVYDPVSRRCTLARAGHVLPILVTRDGTVDLLDLPPGPPLGLGGLPFEAAEVDLAEGSLLALYTDGLIEARDHDVEAGLDLLRGALARAGPSLEATCDTVLEALLPTRPDDDVALLLARTHALGVRQVATWDLEADPAAVGRARADVARQLRIWGLEELDFTTELVVSELVTNAIRYGRPPIQLRLIHDRGLLCEVSDAGGTTPHLRRARTFDEGGRGLFLVAQLAEHWGTRHASHGKTVWAELNESDEALETLLKVTVPE